MTEAIFNYPVEFKSLPEYTAHSGCKVKIIRELIDGVEYDRDPDGELMYRVRAEDGWEGDAFESELVLSSTSKESP